MGCRVLYPSDYYHAVCQAFRRFCGEETRRKSKSKEPVKTSERVIDR